MSALCLIKAHPSSPALLLRVGGSRVIRRSEALQEPERDEALEPPCPARRRERGDRRPRGRRRLPAPPQPRVGAALLRGPHAAADPQAPRALLAGPLPALRARH